MNDSEPENHPAFPQPVDRDVRLWRYMPADRFRSLVCTRRLNMVCTEKLGEPREGTAPGGEAGWWQRLVAEAPTEESRRIAEHNRDFVAQMAAGFRQGYYVTCWGMAPTEVRERWKQYVPGNPEAVAVRTTYSALRECLPSHVFMGCVRYIDYASARLPARKNGIANMFEYITHKDQRFGWECEVRAVATHLIIEQLSELDSVFEREDDPSFRVFAPAVEVTRLVQGVVLHPEAPLEFVEGMERLCAEHQLPRPERSQWSVRR